MKVENIKIENLKPYKNNPRKNDQAVDAVAASIKEFGFKVPVIVDKNLEIVAGHTRYKAALKLGLTEVPCIIADDLTPKQINAFRLADNKTGELAEWDLDLLNIELKELDIDMKQFGFELSGDNPEAFEDDYDTDGILGDGQPPICKPGDIWQLGRHRLMCCDNTVHDDIAKLMDGATGQLCVTDPPYNVDYEGATDKKLQMQNDNMKPEKFQEFLDKSFAELLNHLDPGAAFYIWHSDAHSFITHQACRNVGMRVRQCLVWVKNTFTLGRQDYQWQHEPCLYGWKDGAKHYFTKDRTLCTVLNYDKPVRNEMHPTMKPIKLISALITNSSREGDNVVDYFGGSGSTLTACEMLNRTCYTAEVDPKYCDVIIDRWQTLTGQKAVRVNGE